MSRSFQLILMMLALTVTTNAQEGFQVTGKLVDTLGTPISRATVAVYIAGGKDTIKALSNNVGFFLIKGIPQRKFVLSISDISYGTTLKAYQVPEGEEVLKLDNITLRPQYSQLQEIVISTPPIIVKEDTVEYKADSFRLKPNAMVEDLLKKMPGIEVDKNGNITAQGKTVSKVRVNGKDFFSNDPKAATQQLSADMI
ncbi:MAG: carboxypeptidase-like regulatory domain-containing protein, partial [Chitinophagaceae bacterium]